jgi:hypothetical protein
MGRHSATQRRTLTRFGFAAAGAAVLATGGAAVVGATAPAADAAPLRLTVTGPMAPLYTCDLQSAPEFGDPAHPDEITNRACGYTDDQGRSRSYDPWIDGQLRAAATPPGN